MWKDLVESLTDHCLFFTPALWADVTSSEDKLGIRFPDELRDLLFQSNGIEGEYGLGLVWPVERIVRDNDRFRTNTDFRDLYMPFDSLLFFGDAGNGDQFAFSIVGGAIRRTDVFAWNHENDSRQWVAPSLAKYVEWWLNGTIAL
ncbi:MAG: SMI1/KNR4 family protein [Planctomycetaceae bacterium]